MCYVGFPSILWHQIQSSQSLSYRMYHRRTTAMPTKGKWNDFFFRSSHSFPVVENKTAISHRRCQRQTNRNSFFLSPCLRFFSRLALFILSLATQIIVLSKIYTYLTVSCDSTIRTICAHTGCGFVGNTHTNISNDYRVSLSELCVGLMCASNE